MNECKRMQDDSLKKFIFIHIRTFKKQDLFMYVKRKKELLYFSFE